MEILGLCSRHCCGLYARKVLVIVQYSHLKNLLFTFHFSTLEVTYGGVILPYTDTPFGIDENSDNHHQMATDPDSWLSTRDNYPLMAPWDNYFA